MEATAKWGVKNADQYGKWFHIILSINIFVLQLDIIVLLCI